MHSRVRERRDKKRNDKRHKRGRILRHVFFAALIPSTPSEDVLTRSTSARPLSSASHQQETASKLNDDEHSVEAESEERSTASSRSKDPTDASDLEGIREREQRKQREKREQREQREPEGQRHRQKDRERRIETETEARREKKRETERKYPNTEPNRSQLFFLSLCISV